jgi:hypothetical protein
MLKWLLRRRIDAFEREFGYDASYVREILDADLWAFFALSKFMGVAKYRKDVPADAWYAASLVGLLAEDCGPCTQLATTMAEREGVPPGVLRAVLENDLSATPEHIVLAVKFARESLAHSPSADDLREQVVSRWGRRGLVSLSFALAGSRVYPTVKYALGHGRCCTRVMVAGEPAMVRHEASTT